MPPPGEAGTPTGAAGVEGRTRHQDGPPKGAEDIAVRGAFLVLSAAEKIARRFREEVQDRCLPGA